MSEVRLSVNGEPRRFEAPFTVSGLVRELSLEGKRVAVEVNGEVIPRSHHDRHALADDDRVEIVHAIGGG